MWGSRQYTTWRGSEENRIYDPLALDLVSTSWWIQQTAICLRHNQYYARDVRLDYTAGKSSVTEMSERYNMHNQ